MTAKQKSYVRQLRLYSWLLGATIAGASLAASYGEPVLWGLS